MDIEGDYETLQVEYDNIERQHKCLLLEAETFEETIKRLEG